MREKILKLVGATLATMGAIWLLNVNAQENKRKANGPAVTTNWLGCVVVGREDSVDSIAKGLYPQCAPPFQLGLRSDGVVVWRIAPTPSGVVQQR